MTNQEKEISIIKNRKKPNSQGSYRFWKKAGSRRVSDVLSTNVTNAPKGSRTDNLGLHWMRR